MRVVFTFSAAPVEQGLQGLFLRCSSLATHDAPCVPHWRAWPAGSRGLLLGCLDVLDPTFDSIVLSMPLPLRPSSIPPHCSLGTHMSENALADVECADDIDPSLVYREEGGIDTTIAIAIVVCAFLVLKRGPEA